MPPDYEYPLSQCDVLDRQALEAYRSKRRQWLSWIETDDDHAIWQALSQMIWTDVSFRSLRELGSHDDENALNNSLVAEALLNGHVATQVLGIRRLVDPRRDVISLRRLINDLKANIGLFTRENYVCFDGLPYDYEAVRRRDMEEHLAKGGGFKWGAMTGPEAWGTSSMAHEQFDKLARIDPTNRQRNDELPRSLFATVERWILDSGALDLAEWSHAYLAHAGSPEARQKIAALQVTSDRIAAAIKDLCRVTEAISAWLLFAGGRSGSLMPVAQFNQFEKLDRPVMQANQLDDVGGNWRRLSAERDAYLNGVDVELLRRTKSTP